MEEENHFAKILKCHCDILEDRWVRPLSLPKSLEKEWAMIGVRMSRMCPVGGQ